MKLEKLQFKLSQLTIIRKGTIKRKTNLGAEAGDSASNWAIEGQWRRRKQPNKEDENNPQVLSFG